MIILKRLTTNSMIKWNYTQIRHLAKVLTGQSGGALNEETLTGRILHYLNSTNNVLIKDPLTDTTGHDNINGIISTLNTMDQNLFKNKYDFKRLINALDDECCKHSSELNVQEIFNVLHTLMRIIPNRITEYHYFSRAIEHLMHHVKTLARKDLVQLMFFIGLLKKSPQSQHMMKLCLNRLDNKSIDDLTKEELCIICNSSFKTSTRIKNSYFLEKIKTFICDNLNLLEDPQIFVTFVKTIRHNRYQEDDFLETISCAIIFNKTFRRYSFSAIAHILALYSDYLYYDEKLLRIIVKRGIEQLTGCEYISKRAYLEDQPRGKDIKRFLWALSNLNFRLSKNDIEDAIIPQVIQRIKSGELVNDSSTLVEIILYLWILQYRAYNLIEKGLTNETVKLITAEQSQAKERLNLLLTCMFFEDRKLFDSINIHPHRNSEYNPDPQLQKRPLLNRVFKMLRKVSEESLIDTYKFSCQVPYINIVGITGLRNRVYKAVNIEILDDYTCLKNSEYSPTGLMDLKLRVLDKCDEGLIVISADDIEELSDSELQDLLEEELSLVC